MDGDRFKERVAQSFSRFAATYDHYAAEQRVGAETLGDCAAALAPGLVAGPVLEIGCGTGILSERLVDLLPGRKLELTDLSPAMVARCRDRIAAAGIGHPGIDYGVLDGERVMRQGHYALVCAAFAVHWFADLRQGLTRLFRALKPGGHLLCAYPGAGSYREWGEQCRRLGVPWTANSLPVMSSVAGVFHQHPVAIRQWEQEVVVRHASARAFLHHVKCTGAGVRTRSACGLLGPAEMRRLLRGWDQACPGGVEITCAIHYLAVERQGG